MNKVHRSILEDLEAVRENLLSMSDDIWLSIDHNNTDEMKRGCEFKATYNDKMVAFDTLATDISEIVQKFTQINLESNEQGGAESESENERIIRELDKSTPYGICDDFTFRRPHGFILKETAITGVVTWKRFYTRFCEALHRLDRDRFIQLPQNPEHISSHGNPEFSLDKSHLRDPILIGDSIYAEGNRSANTFRDSIKGLLETFQIPMADLKIYLREDRDAERVRERAIESSASH